MRSIRSRVPVVGSRVMLVTGVLRWIELGGRRVARAWTRTCHAVSWCGEETVAGAAGVGGIASGLGWAMMLRIGRG